MNATDTNKGANMITSKLGTDLDFECVGSFYVLRDGSTIYRVAATENQGWTVVRSSDGKGFEMTGFSGAFAAARALVSYLGR